MNVCGNVTSSVPLLAPAAVTLVRSGDGASPALEPFQVVSLSRAIPHAARLGLGAHHALLFSALYSGLDPSLSAEEAALFSGAAVVCQHSIETALMLPEAAKGRPSAQSKHQLTHMRIVATLVGTPAGTPLSSHDLSAFASLLNELNSPLPRYVLASLLAIPSAPAYLSAVVDWAVVESGGYLNATLFSVLMHALLNNDNFFSGDHFAAMNAIVRDKILARLGASHEGVETGARGEPAGGGLSSSMSRAEGAMFDYISVRWAPLMNKWARVYVKQSQGLALYECFVQLLDAVPGAENKIPCSFYVRTIGGLIDTFGGVGSTLPVLARGEAASSHAPESSDAAGSLTPTSAAWGFVKNVASRGVRLFGRGEADMRSLWVILLKAALTFHPTIDAWSRLLEAYHLCAEHGHQRSLGTDRGAFLQVIRLTSAALNRQTDPEALAAAVGQLCQFFEEQEAVSFLWVLDGVGTVLGQLWQAHGLAAREPAMQLYTLLIRMLNERGVTGIQLDANPVLARAAEDFSLAGATPSRFWWSCGCGTALPAAAKRCATCLRRNNGASWTCPDCHKQHNSLCADQSCDCGCANPRVAAAVACGCAICGSCGEVLAGSAEACPRCQQIRSQAESVTTCTRCGTQNSAKALYCTTCFAVRPDQQLFLWMCGDCHSLNYSTWSTCQQCRAHRRVGAIRVPFQAWRCQCGSLNHPRRLSCDHCSQSPQPDAPAPAGGTSSSKIQGYTCRTCDTMVRTSGGHLPVIRLSASPGLTLVAHVCPHCQTVHPRDQLVLYAPTLPRHCLRCGDLVSGTAARRDGCFYHCGVHQHINEHYPFQCPYCSHGSEHQTGYHCHHCLQPRPDAELFSDGDNTCFLWRCVRESGPDGGVCGAWNYSWQDRCRSCGDSRGHSPWENRARAYAWQCPVCQHQNRPVDVLTCAGCGCSSQPITECDICGVPHLTHSCCA